MARGREQAAVLNAPVEGPWELPEGWRWVDLGRLLGGRSKSVTPSKFPNDVFELYSVPSFDSRSPEVLTGAEIGSSKQIVSQGDVLLCKINPRINRAWVVGSPRGYPQIASTEWIRFAHREDIDPHFLCHYLSTEAVRSYLAMNASGVGGSLMRVKAATLDGFPIPVPPLETQRRIVARIDELFSELDDGEAALARAREDLEVYRKALLKAAVTGELTADWRAANPCTETGEQLLKRILAERKSSSRSNRQAIREIEDAHLWGIPKTWAWCRTDVAGFVQLGRQRTPKDHVGPDMRPYLRVANVFEDRICTADVKQMNFSDKEYEIYRLNAGDILLNEGQSLELIGRPAMFRGEVDGCCFQNTLVRFQAARGVNPEFALLTFLDAMHRGRFRRIAKITTNIAHLGAARFAELGFPLPPEEEQSEIVRLYRGQVDDLKSMADTLQTTSSLRQSILAAAFKGELVQ